MPGIMLNEDCNHYVISRHYAGVDVTREILLQFVDQYRDTGVTDLVLNPVGMLAFYPSSRLETIFDRFEAISSGQKFTGNTDWVAAAYELYMNKGLDQWGIWLDRAREVGIKGWLSIRMNDIHDSFDEQNIQISQFYIDNPDKRRVTHRAPTNYWDKTPDFASETIRRHYLDILEDFCELYDFDGLELDFMREIYGTKVGHEYEATAIYLQFVSQVRARLDTYALLKGHPVRLAVRVPSRPELALRWGFDVMTMARRHLVDLVVVTPRWRTIETDMPVDLWRKMLDGTGVTLAAGLEILIEGSRHGDWLKARHACNTVETATGAAAAFLSLGADCIYLFNYMDFAKPIPDPEMCRTSPAASKYYRQFLATAADPAKASAAPRRHVVTFTEIAAPGTRSADILPFDCPAPDADGKRTYADARILNGQIAAGATIRLVAGIQADCDLAAGDLDIFINCLPCTYLGKVQLDTVRPDSVTYAFDVPNDGNFSPVSIVEIASLAKPFTVDWLELDVNWIRTGSAG